MSIFLSVELCETDVIDWKAVLISITGEKELTSLYKKAKQKMKDGGDNRKLCRTILFDWMKTTPRQQDKVRSPS